MRAEYIIVFSGFLLAGCAGMGPPGVEYPWQGGNRSSGVRGLAGPASLTIAANSGGSNLCEAAAHDDAAYGSYDPQTRDHVHALRLAQCRALMES